MRARSKSAPHPTVVASDGSFIRSGNRLGYAYLGDTGAWAMKSGLILPQQKSSGSGLAELLAVALIDRNIPALTFD
jgi:hypothetical protein